MFTHNYYIYRKQLNKWWVSMEYWATERYFYYTQKDEKEKKR